MNDKYEHLDGRLIYVVENIPGPHEDTEEFAEIMNNFNSQLTDHCRCVERCAPATCSCLQRSGGSNYILHDVTELQYILNYSKDFRNYPIIECNSLCICSGECGNRVIQRGPIEGLIINSCTEKGMGLFTKNPISNGTFICEYAGEVITKSEALKRQHTNNLEGKMNYIYCLNEHSCDKITQTFVDPSHFGNIGRYMNHGCEPNCHIIPARADTPIPKLAIFSCLEILANEELTFDYSSHIKDFVSVDGSAKMDINSKKKCLCNSHKCKGLLPFDTY